MQFSEIQAIYLQIAVFIEDKILQKEWVPEERIPSVRDLAVEMEVNPNTVMRTYELLQQKGIIFNKRGVGYFVSENAVSVVLEERKKSFSEQDLPVFFRNISLLGISMDEISGYYQQYLKQVKK